jgi:putative ABC transport system substrate-binding protein
MKRRSLIALLGGAVVAFPFAGRAQQKAMPVIGILSGSSPGPFAPLVAALRQGLGETGFVEGQNAVIEYRWAEGHQERLPALAADFVTRKVDLIVTTGGAASAHAAKTATSTIPIVFTTGSDAVESGLVDSLARPGGNLTGVTILNVKLIPKRIELIAELVPEARMIAILVNPNNAGTEPMIHDVPEAARTKGLELPILNASTESEIDTAFASLDLLHAAALVIAPDPFFGTRWKQFVTLASRHNIPAISAWREFVVAGGLISYGPSLTGAYRQVGVYAGKILNGAKPADLPVQQPTKFELVINLNTAKALGLTIPEPLLARADQVIE